MLFIAMRYVAGGDAQSLLNREGPLPPGRVAAIISPVASALDAAHRAGLVHRDVKPSNMLMDILPGRPDHVYLSDFGVSKVLASRSAMTTAGTIIGTLGYMSPEQIAGKPVDGLADQYALACSAFELLAGALPFQRDEPTAEMYAHLSESPPQLTSRRPGLPPAVDSVLSRALAKAPGDRYTSCGQFAEALRDALGVQPYRSGPGARLAAARPPAETVRPAALAGGEHAQAPGHPVRSYDQTPATPVGTVPPVVTPAAPPTVIPSLVQEVPPPRPGPGGVPADGYGGSSGPETSAGGQSQGPGSAYRERYPAWLHISPFLAAEPQTAHCCHRRHHGRGPVFGYRRCRAHAPVREINAPPGRSHPVTNPSRDCDAEPFTAAGCRPSHAVAAVGYRRSRDAMPSAYASISRARPDPVPELHRPWLAWAAMSSPTRRTAPPTTRQPF